MNNWDFKDWFGIISGGASIVSLILVFVIKNEVNNIKQSFKLNNKSKDSTAGDESPIQKHSGQGDNNYKGGK